MSQIVASSHACSFHINTAVVIYSDNLHRRRVVVVALIILVVIVSAVVILFRRSDQTWLPSLVGSEAHQTKWVP